MNEIKEKPDAKQIRDKLIGKLVESGWASFLRAHLRSCDFQSIVDFLVNENQEGRRFTPPLKQLFRAFDECPLEINFFRYCLILNFCTSINLTAY